MTAHTRQHTSSSKQFQPPITKGRYFIPVVNLFAPIVFDSWLQLLLFSLPLLLFYQPFPLVKPLVLVTNIHPLICDSSFPDNNFYHMRIRCSLGAREKQQRLFSHELVLLCQQWIGKRPRYSAVSFIQLTATVQTFLKDWQGRCVVSYGQAQGQVNVSPIAPFHIVPTSSQNTLCTSFFSYLNYIRNSDLFQACCR